MSLDLSFSLRRPSDDVPVSFQSSNNSESENSQEDFSLRVQGSGFSYFNIESKDSQLPAIAIANVVQDAVKNFYQSFSRLIRRYLEDQGGSRLTSVVSEILSGNRISIPLGQSDLLRERDVFNVYAKGGCNITRHFGYVLNTAVVREIDEYNSILSISPTRSEMQDIKVGDIVELSRGIALGLRAEDGEYNNPAITLRIGSIPRIPLYKQTLNGKEFISGNITPYIRHFLDVEGLKLKVFRVIL